MKNLFLTLLLALTAFTAFSQSDTLSIERNFVSLKSKTDFTAVPFPVSYVQKGNSFVLTGANGKVIEFDVTQLSVFYLNGASSSVAASTISAKLMTFGGIAAPPRTGATDRSGATVYEFMELEGTGLPNFDLMEPDYLGFRYFNNSADTVVIVIDAKQISCLPYSCFEFLVDFDREAGRYLPCPTVSFVAPSTGRALLQLIPNQSPAY